MATRAGYLCASASSGDMTPGLTVALTQYQVDYWPFHVADLGTLLLSAPTTAHLPIASHTVGRSGYLAHSYFDDFYNRIYAIPSRIDLGNITSAQIQQVEIWNAWLVPRTLQSIDVVDGDGIQVAGPGAVPQTYNALASKLWDVTVSTEGGSTLDARVVWDFDIGSGEVAITANRIVPWVVPPDWAGGVRERLAWLTDVMRARSGESQKRQLRLAPRRGFDFDVIAEGRERRVIDALLFDWSARVWALPIWHDVQRLGVAVPAGVSSIPCRTEGFDFVDGGIAMLWTAVNVYEVVEVETVGAASLALTRTTTQDWPAGTRLYPVRTARLQEWPQEQAWTDAAGKRPVSFNIDEPCDWPEALPATLYRGYPVLEWRPDEGEDPTARYDRAIDVIDTNTGAVSVTDWPNVPFRNASARLLLSGREDHSAMRSLLYGLRGQIAELWVPSWAADLQLVQPVGSASTSLIVDWCGYTKFGRLQSNRRDIRIELFDGTVLYRRILGAAEAGETEQLAIDAPLGIEVTPGGVRVISFMTFSEQAGDSIEIHHTTDADGVGAVATAFRGIKHDH